MADQTFDIEYVANLARLSLSDEEKQQLGSQLGQILDYIDQLNEVDVEGVEATAHPFPLVNVMRDDVIEGSLPHNEAMQNAPKKLNGLFQVPKIVE
ncbi:MAG: Asp-tRNA(Asn)/Glu-tRNA(Gln) amidotransferase GatCAB subunit C [Verrucomicrobiales bacterium]|nr:Asp-tRNA(Asn)/Glu-tRNA(Gln) amidotransferase GatCAB subunit C [Verrucomicrobiales bacterium]|tara:strand:+ start:238 stop:525 length:288 start_codon:yes stop_codon:yes gene_type:complete